MTHRYLVLSIGSSSRGNSVLLIKIFSDRAYGVLFDAGCSGKRVKEAVQWFQQQFAIELRVECIVLTHVHGDHAGSIIPVAKTLAPRFILYPDALRVDQRSYFSDWQRIRDVTYDMTVKVSKLAGGRLIGMLDGQSFELPRIGAKVTVCEVPHDALCMALSLNWGDFEIAYVVDLGSTTNELLQFCSSADLLILEMNYDELAIGNPAVDYPRQLIERIRGRYGHLSNSESKAFIQSLLAGRSFIQGILAAHLGGQTNTSAMAYNYLIAATKINPAIKIGILPRKEGGAFLFSGRSSRGKYLIQEMESTTLELTD